MWATGSGLVFGGILEVILLARWGCHPYGQPQAGTRTGMRIIEKAARPQTLSAGGGVLKE